MGWFDDTTGSDAFQIGLPLITAFLSSHPQGQQIAQGLNAGLRTSNYFANQNRVRDQSDQTRQAIDNLSKANEFVTPKIQGSAPLGSAFTPEQIAKTPMLQNATASSVETGEPLPADQQPAYGSFTKAPTNTQPLFHPANV